MAGNAYPHIIFAKDAETLPKERLGEIAVEVLGGTATPGSINLVVDVDGYAVTFWYDDDAEGLAERYADFLPESVRRRRFTAATTMIDASGDADDDHRHARALEGLWARIAATEGVWVFSETTKQFVGVEDGAPSATPVPVPVEDEPEAPFDSGHGPLEEADPLSPSPDVPASRASDPTAFDSTPAEQAAAEQAGTADSIVTEPNASERVTTEPTAEEPVTQTTIVPPRPEPIVREAEPEPETERETEPAAAVPATGDELAGSPAASAPTAEEAERQSVERTTTPEDASDSEPAGAAADDDRERDDEPAAQGGFFRRLFGRRK